MKEISAPFIPESIVDRLLTDIFSVACRFENADGSPRSVTGWNICIEITNDFAEAWSHTIETDSQYLTIDNDKVTLRAPSPVALGIGFSEELRQSPFLFRWYQNTDDGQITFWYVDVTLYKRLPKDRNAPGPLMAEKFVNKIAQNGGVTVETEF
ncbi:hypothetical protein GCM10027347_52670 [Larkinella harenae]